MIQCPNCSTPVAVETLTPENSLVCPQCGTEFGLDIEDFDLSSLPEGSATEGTPRPDSASGSSFAASGFVDSDLASDEASDLASDVPSSDPLPEGTLQASGGYASDEVDPDEETPVDMTMVFGGRHERADDDEDPLMLGDEGESDEDDSDDLDARDPGESLDATVDFGHLARLANNDPDADGGEGLDATVALGGKQPPPRLRPAEPSDPAGPDLTQMVGLPGIGAAGASSPRSKTPYDATVAADSDAPSKGESDSSLMRSSSLAASDVAGDRTESPSTHAEGRDTDRDSATLAFDSERRSDRVGTPEPIDITGLSSGNTIPRGPLEDGRGSNLLKPGDSQIVGDESVRLRTFLLAKPEEADAGGLDYSIEGEAGKGGMGVVYKARQQSLNRRTAIKQIKSDLGASASDCNKFISEAVITGQLEHPNVIPVHDLGFAADGTPFYSMKFVEGEEWEKALKRLSEEENLAILIQVAQAIAFAHSREVLHRDLKPGNIMLGHFGEVLVMDWGLAARLDDGSEIQPAGTPIYMPPETALEYLDYAKGRVVGRKVGSSRKRTPAGKYGDIYLLGALLFKIVTGRAPHRGKTTFECLRAAAKNEIVKVKRSSELLDIAYKAMASDIEDRHPSALDFVEALKSYQAHAQSIKIARRASQELRVAETLRETPGAETTEMYASYSRAQHGYQNALELWSENNKAKRRLTRTLRHFGEAAYANGDYDLALSLLDDQSEADAELRTAVLKDQKARTARLAWFKTLQYATAASLALALAFIAFSVVMHQDAVSARSIAKAEIENAETAKKLALNAQDLADKARLVAEAETAKAEQAKADADEAVTERNLARDAADRAKALADKAEAQLRIAAQAEAVAVEKAAEADRKAREQSYYAVLGSIKSTLSDYGTYAAWKVMQSSADKVPADRIGDPEWLKLTKTVAWQSEATELVTEAAATGPTLAASSRGGEWCVTAVNAAGGGCELTVYRGEANAPATTFTVPGGADAVAIDHEGSYVALVGGGLRVIDVATKQPLEPAGDRQAAATCVAFHPGKPELLVGDKSSRVTRWEIAGGSLRQSDGDPVVNEGPIAAVGYSPDGKQRFSACAAGRIVLWRDLGDGSLPNRETYSHSLVSSGSANIRGAAMADDRTGRLAFGCEDGAVYEISGWWPQADAKGTPIDRNRQTTRPPTATRLAGTDFLDASPTRLHSMHPGAVTGVAYSADQSLVLSAGKDTLLVQHSPSLGEEGAIKTERRYHDATVLSVAAGPSGSAFSSDETGRVLRWTLQALPEQLALDPPADEASAVVAMRFDVNDAGQGGVVVAGRNGFVRRWADARRPAQSEAYFTGHAEHRDMRAWRLEGDEPRLLTLAPERRRVTDRSGRTRRVTVNRLCEWDGATGLLRSEIDLGERLVVAVDEASGTLYAASASRIIDAADARPTAIAVTLDGGEATPLWDRAWRVATIEPLRDVAPGEPTLAVGLRDGQVFLWGPQSGRVELVRSSARPHWLPIRSLAFDGASGRLYSGDNSGLLVGWSLDGGVVAKQDLGAGAKLGVAPIVRIEVGGAGRVLALQRTETGAVTPRLLDASLRVVATAGPAIDADIDPVTDALVVLRRNGAGGIDLARIDNAGASQTVATAAASSTPLAGLAAGADGWLTWGPGVAEWRPSAGGGYRVATHVTSRPTPIALVNDPADNRLLALTNDGSLDAWDLSGGTSRQSWLGEHETPVAACRGAGDDELVVAVTDQPTGQTSLQRWDVVTQRQRAVVATGLPAGCRAMTATVDAVFVAFADRVAVVPLAGGPAVYAALPAGVAPPTSIAAKADGSGFAVATQGGAAVVAARTATGWGVAQLDREDVASVGFTPAGDRLLVGNDSGRVLMLELAEPQAGKQTSRPLLTFSGHSDRVTRLEVATTNDGAKLLSGDAAGRVIVRSL